MKINCLNCGKNNAVYENKVGQPFICFDCKSENFAEVFSEGIMYVKNKTVTGEITTFGRCKNSDCEAHYADTGLYMLQDLRVGEESPEISVDFKDCPECGMQGRPYKKD